MRTVLIACASGAALLFGVSASAGETTAADLSIEKPSDGAPVESLTDPTAELEVTVEGDVAPEGEGDIDAELEVEGDIEAEVEAEGDADAEVTVEGEVAPEGEGDIDFDAEGEVDGEAAVEEPTAEAEGEAEVEVDPNGQ